MTDHRTILLAAGTSSGFTASALVELLRSVNWVNLLTFCGTVISTGIALYVSARAAKREQDHLDRQARAADDLAELLARSRLHDGTAPAVDSAQPQH